MRQRYYFDLRDADGVTRDEEGVELPDIEAALEEAALALADMARGVALDDIGSGHQMAIEVRDERGPLLQANFVFEVERHRQ